MRRGLIIGLGVAVLAVAVGGWYFFIRDDAPEELSLEAAVTDIVGTTEAEVDTDGTAPPPTTSAPSATTAPVSLDGNWVIETVCTEVGYRIGEELSGIGTF